MKFHRKVRHGMWMCMKEYNYCQRTSREIIQIKGLNNSILSRGILFVSLLTVSLVLYFLRISLPGDIVTFTMFSKCVYMFSILNNVMHVQPFNAALK